MKSFKKIALLIRQTRESKDFSQAKLARKLEFKNSQFVSNIERGLSSLPGKKIKLAAYVLDIETDVIVDAMVSDYKKTLELTIKGE